MLGPLLTQILSDKSPVQLRSIMGCENRVMLAIAHIAALASFRVVPASDPGAAPWGLDLPDTGAIARYATFIREMLLQPPQYPVSPTATSAWVPPPDLFSSSPNLASRSFQDVSQTPCASAAKARWADNTMPVPVVTLAFRAAACVYLETTLAGYQSSFPDTPSIPHVASDVPRAVDSAVRAIRQIPITDADRSMIWPLCLIGCQASRAEDQRYFTMRFGQLEGRERLGNGANAYALMRSFWYERERSAAAMAGGRVCVPARDWIDCMGHKPILLA